MTHQKLLHESAQPHHDTGGKRQRDTQSSKKVGEDGHHPLEQGADNQRRHADDGDGIDQRRFHGRFQANRLLDVDRQALQNDVENTAGFTRFNHVGGEVVEDGGILAHGIGQRRAAFHRGADAGQRLLEDWFSWLAARISRHCTSGSPASIMTENWRKKIAMSLTLTLLDPKVGMAELFALFPDCARRDALAPQLLSQRLLVWRYALSGNFLSGCILAGKCEDWHGFNLSSSVVADS